MDIFFQDPTEVPLPPDEVRIRILRAEPWPDGVRVRVYLETDPFQKRPNANLIIAAPDGEDVAHVSVIETMTRKMEMTMHLRHPAGQPPAGEYRIAATLFYAEHQEGEEGAEPPEPVVTVVDEAETQFSIET